MDGRDCGDGCWVGRVLRGVVVECASCGEEQGEKVTVGSGDDTWLDVFF